MYRSPATAAQLATIHISAQASRVSAAAASPAATAKKIRSRIDCVRSSKIRRQEEASGRRSKGAKDDVNAGAAIDHVMERPDLTVS